MGSDSILRAMKIQHQLLTALRSIGLKFQKRCMNNSLLLNSIPVEVEKRILILAMKLNINLSDRKRVSSGWTRIIDPLRKLSSVIITVKIFISQLWQLKISPDDSNVLQITWAEIIEGLYFPQHIFRREKPKRIQIHSLTDASEKACGTSSMLILGL